jgi:hypothetical protein
MRRKQAIALLATAAAGGAVLGNVIAPQGEVDATYQVPWSRANVRNIAFSGLHERYRFGQSWWVDDDTWNPYQEGADCSGYVGKAYATPVATAIGTNYGYPDSNTWYAGSVDGSSRITDMFNPNVSREMNVWVRQGHMGLWEGTYNKDLGWKIYHAKGSNYGIVEEYKTDGSWGSGYRRYKRSNW